MNREEEFEKWFDEYFLSTQGFDSPFSYKDVREAFFRGYKIGKVFDYFERKK